MDETPHQESHHRSARERQRRGPMWGCLKGLVFTFGALFLVLLIIFGGGWWYLGTASFAGLIQLRIAKTLESKLGRHVSIHDVVFYRTRPTRVVINDLRIANSPGAVNPYFATVQQIEITGGIESFWGRQINVSRVDVRNPHLYFEVYPAGSKLVHNFPHWQPGPKSKYDIYHLDLGTLFIRGGVFDFLDRRHDITATTTNINSDVKVTLKEDLYAGTMSSPLARIRIQNYEPFDLDLRGGFRYTPGVLELSSIAMRGRDMQMFVSGRLDPLTEGAYNLRLTSQLGLNRVREIFKVNKVLDGAVTLDANLRGESGTFRMQGGWIANKINADVYDLAALKGRLDITDKSAVVDVNSAKYGGGTISAHYVLPKYDEPYPQTVDLHYDGVSIEKLFSDWGVKDTGLRGGATGRLAFHWNKDKVLEGGGEGSAVLAKLSAAGGGGATYPLPVGGSSEFAIENGIVKFSRGELVTDKSRINFTGSLRIADIDTNLDIKIHSSDFSELDRAAYNFAHSAGKQKFTLLGFGGSGDITAAVHGPIKSPQLVAHIDAAGAKYNNQILGDGSMDIKYDGVKSVMTFERASFALAGGRMSMTGTMVFPDRGPSPRFDLAIDARNYPADSAIKVVDLPFKGITGAGTGKLLVTGTPEEGKVRFVGLTITKAAAELRLNGEVAWHPGKGNSTFNLDIAARQFPVAEIATFLELGTLPVTGELTGTLHLEGPKSKLEGAGAVTVRKGTVFGEPVDVATADILFTQGRIKATNINIAAPAGTITAEGEANLTTNQFSYIIKSASLDLSKLKILSSLAGLLGGKVTLTSSGGGTFDQPELVVTATLTDATIRGLALPPGSAPPQIYFAIRNGQMIVKGSIAEIVTIEGNGTVGKDLAIDGLVRVTVPDVSKLVALSPSTASLPAAGHFIVDMKLSGKMSPLEALRIDGTFPEFDLKLSDHEFTAPRPLRFGLRGGRIVIDDFQLTHPDGSFSLAGFADLAGKKLIDIDMKGEIEASLLQIFVHDLRADGHIIVNAGVTGTIADPHITGSGEVQNAQFRFAGFPQIIDHVTGTVLFKPDRIEIDSLRAAIGGGTVVAGGIIGVNGLKPTNVRLTLQGTDVSIRYFEGLTIASNFSMLLSGDADRVVLTGDVDVNRALYFKDIDFGAAVLNAVLSRKSVTPIVAANWQDRVSLRLHVNAPNTLAVRNNIADVTGSAVLDVTGTLANPSIIGTVTLNEGGRVRLQNVDYTVTRGTINFQNPFRIDPYFDVTIEGRVSGGGFSELESGPIDVTVNLVGTLDRFTPSITSDPPASDITLFSLLGFGAFTSQRAGLMAAGSSPFSQGMLLQSLSSLIGNKILPFVDSFTYDPGNLDTTDDPGAKVTLERRISNNIRVLIIYNLEHPHSRALLEWQVNPDWTLRITNDEVRHEYRAEARFRRRYEGHWAWGGSNEKDVTLFASMGNVAAPPKIEEATVPPPSDAPIVARIDYRADARFDTKVLTDYVALKVGRPMSLRSVQSSIKSLFATGDFRDIRVETTPTAGEGAGAPLKPNSVDVVFVLSLNYRIAEVSFDGLHGKERERAEREMSIHVGDVLSLNAVDRSATAVQEYLNRVGYLEAAVDPETQFERARSRATVIMHMTTGQRAQVRSVVVDGNVAPFTPEQLIAQMKRGPGRTFRVFDARSDADRMERFMIRRDYRKADVRYVNYVYDAATKSVTLHYTATAGPKVKVEVTGVPRRAVRRLTPFSKNEAYSQDVIDTAADDIVKAYQARGYFNAAVDTEEHLDAATNTWITTFHINPGQHFSLAAVAFSGNEKIPDNKLRAVIQTAPESGFKEFIANIFRRPTAPTRAQLSADRDAIESYYRLNGFSEATVETPKVITDAKLGTMIVDFPIKEGPQTIVSDINIEGMQQVRPGDLPRMQLRPGQPLNPQMLRNDLLAIQQFYADRGNAEVQVTPRPELSPDKTHVKLTYTVAEGPRIKVDQVIVRGNTYTHTSVIERKSDLDKGDPFSYTKILQAQQNLYRLGIFQRVDIQPEQAGTSVADRNVTIQVEEGKDLAVSGSLGLSKQTGLPFSPLGSASIAHRNLFGTGRYLGFESIISRGQRREFFLTEREPFLGPWDIPLQFNIFQSDEHRPSAHIRQRGGSVEASKIARFQTRWSVRYEYRIGECIEDPNNTHDLCTQAKQALIPGVGRDITNIQISSVTPTFFWDRRDDPIDPHHGFFTSASIEYAFPLAAATADFTKEYAQASYYLALTDRTVFAISSRAGLIQPRNDTIVPYTERFTGGGESSHRAYQLDLLGDLCPPNANCSNFTLLHPLDKNGNPTTIIAPLGGNAIFITNLEYRFPIFSTVGGALFTDIGNVFAHSTIEFNSLRYGIGTGIRYLSPVGPLRFDIGYKLHRRSYEKPFAYFVTLGYAF
jgi:outer membrane protein assembly complex protein YaeT